MYVSAKSKWLIRFKLQTAEESANSNLNSRSAEIVVAVGVAVVVWFGSMRNGWFSIAFAVAVGSQREGRRWRERRERERERRCNATGDISTWKLPTAQHSTWRYISPKAPAVAAVKTWGKNIKIKMFLLLRKWGLFSLSKSLRTSPAGLFPTAAKSKPTHWNRSNVEEITSNAFKLNELVVRK